MKHNVNQVCRIEESSMDQVRRIGGSSTCESQVKSWIIAGVSPREMFAQEEERI